MEYTAQRQKTSMTSLPLRAARRRKTSESGQTMIEFALMLPFMMLLMLGIVELGRAAFITITVTNAATAGAEFGSQNGATAAATEAGHPVVIGSPIAPTMPSAALCDANGSTTLTCRAAGILPNTIVCPTGPGAPGICAQNGCVCDNGTGVSCNPMPAPGTCTGITCGGGQVVTCVQVTTHVDFNSLLNYPGLPTSFQANGKAIMRVRK